MYNQLGFLRLFLILNLQYLDLLLAGLVKSLANPIHFSETPASYRSAAPALGEHNQVILQGLGYTSQKIKEFMEKGIV